MERMLGPKRPFYKAGRSCGSKIPADEFAASIDARFKRSGMRADDGLGTAIVDLGVTCRTTCSGWRTKRGTKFAGAAGGARRSRICIRRSSGCLRSSR